MRVLSRIVLCPLAGAALLCGAVSALAQTGLHALPVPQGDPLAIDPAQDPVLALGEAAGAEDAFRQALAEAVARNPALAEAQAAGEEARAARSEARTARLPTVTLGLSSYRTLSRSFDNDPNYVIERLRAPQRTDTTVSLDQPLFDGGASNRRIGAAGDRLRAAAAGVDSAAEDIALRAIAAWYDVYAGRTLVQLDMGYAQEIGMMRAALAERIERGASAPTDVARMDSVAASIATRLAGYRRQLANAEARFSQLTGAPPPGTLDRAPLLGQAPEDGAAARQAADDSPAVQGAQAQAAGSRKDARAAHADLLPRVSAGMDAGRYGVFENDQNYDVRARVSLNYRFSFGASAHAHQADARASAALARADRVREEAARDAAIARSDLDALNEQIAALRVSYIAARRSRDVLAERFRVSRGDLFDVMASNTAMFDAAAAYIEALSQRDAAHYVLLSRTGRLLPALGLASAMERIIR
ncbi:TolC family protein [Novosphingobium sp.]|uniref:TolC family protein n=1 Tax=Novosphingobium sp. TaxID=1874826 RepID=UPI0031D0602F